MAKKRLDIPNHNTRNLFILIVLLLSSFSGWSCIQSDNDKNENLQLSEIKLDELFQLAIDQPALQEFFHAEMESRKVLSITGEHVPADIRLIKYGQPVKIVSSSTQCENCITFDVAYITDTTARFEMDYKIEGVRCLMEFELDDDTWRVVNSHIFEY